VSLATARTRGRAASLALAWTVVSCSSYVGRAEQRDAGGVVATDHGPPRDLPPTGDRGPARLVCGDYAFACHPLTNEGCGAGLACVIDTLLPPTAGCAAPGRRGLGLGCDARVPSMRCADGLQRLAGRCLRPCCATDDARCRAVDTLSACAVFTQSETVYGCTLTGACSYRPQGDCSDGEQCFPQTEFGEAICRPVGGNPDGARCVDQNDCAAGSTCLLFGMGAGVGVCRPACNPRDRPRCDASACVRMYDRPSDFGACE
jgi:hypothetical protein